MPTFTLRNLNAGHLFLMAQGIYFFCDACMQEEERRQLEIAQRRAEHGLVWVWLLVVLYAWSCMGIYMYVNMYCASRCTIHANDVPYII